MLRRLIHFAGTSVAVEYGSETADIVDFLFQGIVDLPTPRTATPTAKTSLSCTFRLQSHDGCLKLYADDVLRFSSTSRALLAEQLLGDVCRTLAEYSQGGLLFHAAAVRWQDKGLLLPGSIGAGKTTLTAWLLTQGFTYLTDELVFVPEGTDEIHTFPRPLNVKQGAFAALHPYFDIDAHPQDILRSSTAVLIPSQVFSSITPSSISALSSILFPHYEDGGAFTMTSLSPGQTGLRLMQCLVNARNLETHGFTEVARLARRGPAYALTYSQFAQLGTQIHTVFA